jgi:ABC-type Mn2+/Zn2+ transport system permease subunit
MKETLDLLGQPFIHDALKAALLVAVLCSYLGVFVVLKRIVFVGAALAEVSSLGAALAFFPLVMQGFDALSGALPALKALDEYKPLLLAMVLMLVAVSFFSQQQLVRRLPREAIIGLAYAGAIGLSLLALSQNPSGKEHAMDVLNGNILGVSPGEIAQLAWAAVIVALVQALFFKEFLLISFDPEVARTLGYRSSRWELLWYLTLGVMIAVSIHVAGTVLVFAYLVIPPVTALLLSRRLPVVLCLSVLFSVVATVAGVVISASPADLPTSPTIVGCSVAIYVVCALGKALAGLRPVKA